MLFYCRPGGIFRFLALVFIRLMLRLIVIIPGIAMLTGNIIKISQFLYAGNADVGKSRNRTGLGAYSPFAVHGSDHFVHIGWIGVSEIRVHFTIFTYCGGSLQIAVKSFSGAGICICSTFEFL